VRENEVVVRDLKSRNGTFVNNEPVKTDADTIVLNGDVLRVGPIEFEVVVDQARAKNPIVKDIKDVAMRTAGGKPGKVNPAAATQDLSDVDRWLQDEDEKEVSKLKSEPETRQFRLDDTSHTGIVATGEPAADPNQETKVEEPIKKKEPGKLPPRAAVKGNNSREAAADMLKKLFNRR
jgi:pSer/pThr/pTyr-binding forkhead associated (FHA) protein